MITQLEFNPSSCPKYEVKKVFVFSFMVCSPKEWARRKICWSFIKDYFAHLLLCWYQWQHFKEEAGWQHLLLGTKKCLPAPHRSAHPAEQAVSSVSLVLWCGIRRMDIYFWFKLYWKVMDIYRHSPSGSSFHHIPQSRRPQGSTLVSRKNPRPHITRVTTETEVPYLLHRTGQLHWQLLQGDYLSKCVGEALSLQFPLKHWWCCSYFPF